jgi:CheY-like chemotaxis protein
MWDRLINEIIGAQLQAEVPYDALMPRRVSNLLLVSSLYDYYTIIEDGRLSEMLYTEYLDLDLRFTPSIERVSTAEKALEKLHSEQFDLIISTARVGDMNVSEFGRAVREINPQVPIVLLAGSNRELSLLPRVEELQGIDSVFVWLGDVKLFLAIIKYIEDRLNAEHDAQAAGVKSIILIEDSVPFYSSYLPMLYMEILNQTRALSVESVNRAQKIMRMRARPKVLLARSFEESLRLYERHKQHLLGIIIDAAFPDGGTIDPHAGLRFARLVKDQVPDLPILMQSDLQNAEPAAALGLEFIDKNSPTLLAGLRAFMQQRLGFGEFVFLTPDGSVLSRAPDLRTLEWAIQAVPEEHIYRNVARNDFYMWLTARTEFELAEAVRTIVQNAGTVPGGIRERILAAIRAYRQRSVSGVVAEYSSRTFEGGSGFVRIGTGSLGGKGRGLAFLNSLVTKYQLEHRFAGVRIFIPPTAVLATGVFNRFMESSGLLSYALEEPDDGKITKAFLEAEFPADILENLWNFIQWVRYPLAVRSSSLLEDASYQPFAGIYKTFMIPNNDDDPEIRLAELCDAIKMVYASTYHSDPKAYMESLPNRLEEEKMAVIIQQVVGKQYDSHLYPNFAGVGRSLNFYPMPGMKPEDGIVSVALGMGKTVVDGGRCVRFCPASPRTPVQSFTPDEYVENSQNSFLALDLSASPHVSGAENRNSFDLVPLDLAVAERDGTLHAVGSVYSPDDNAVFDGIARPGIRLVTMAGVLKSTVFPLADIAAFMLKVGAAVSSCPVEIEFAVNLSDDPSKEHEFACLQVRPLVQGSEVQEVIISALAPQDAVCISHKALGNGFIRDVFDVVYVRKDTFDRSETLHVAEEIGIVNSRLRQQKKPYLLAGPGRWGSADPWLGIPVKWAQISGARCIIETGFEDMQVDPSQGSHFFQNIVSLGIGYLNVDMHKNSGDLIDSAWLDLQPAETETRHLRHIVLGEPLRIILNGRKNHGVVLKPQR